MLKIESNGRHKVIEYILAAIMIAAILALIALIYSFVRPIALVDIKTPVATDQASYYPGEEISGIFFGEVFYNGSLNVTREVFCENYRKTIKTDEGDDIFRGASVPKRLEGATLKIGLLPADVPIGSNCVIQFVNTYSIKTPFGQRNEDYPYFTQNFSIVTKARRDQLECEAAGGTSTPA